ncbi:hypothetical protein J1N35_044014 [Gossypium stocksii]|uniref:DUF4283 domain-containing protein n=1 Tax=Gossypium stocksii TaxID=47602 RepID=A0A9D3U8P2_9ROSI|nr:hypothetical protein J1N35_044014 [Gossypium stocksii]
MNMEDELANLNLVDEEDETVYGQEEEEIEDFRYCRVGRVLTESAIHFPSMKNVLAELWHPIEGVAITEIEDKRIFFRFYNEIDILRVVDETGQCKKYGKNKKLNVDSRMELTANWALEKEFADQVKQEWISTEKGLMEKLEDLGRKLKSWAKTTNWRCTKRREEFNMRLKKLDEEDPNEARLAQIIKQRRDIGSNEQEQIDSVWVIVTLLSCLEDGNGKWLTGEKELNELATNYFRDLFTSKQVQNCERLREEIRPCITKRINEERINEEAKVRFKEEEVMEALKSKAPLRASGKDRYPVFFYKKCWHIVREDVTSFCLEVLNRGKDIKQINGTNIVLIPKIESPKNMSQFRPTSLSNVIYKIISKTMVNRFRKVLDICIDESQGAFYQEDDGILFVKALLERAEAIKIVIKEYEDSSGQLVNFDKSLIYFSNNTNEGVKSKVGEILRVRIANNPEKHLGLQTMVGRRKMNAFVELK